MFVVFVVVVVVVVVLVVTVAMPPALYPAHIVEKRNMLHCKVLFLFANKIVI